MESINVNQLANDTYDTLRAVFINSPIYRYLVKLYKTEVNASYASCIFYRDDFMSDLFGVEFA
jgi:hypothetical protein